MTLLLMALATWLPAQEGFRGVPLGSSVNSEGDELQPRFSPDGQSLYFSRGNGNGIQEIHRATRTSSGDWTKSLEAFAELDAPNGSRHQFIGHIGKDRSIWWGNAHGENSPGLIQHQDVVLDFPIKYKELEGNHFGFALTGSEDIMVLSLALNGEKHDLYVAFRENGNQWTRPRLLPNSINTVESEVAPWISEDGKTLFFTSNGHPDHLGAGDIYMSERLDESWNTWSVPVHLGQSINTAGWDGHFVLHPTEEAAYFVSGPEPGSLGDIYRIPLSEIPVFAPEEVLDTLFVSAEQDQPQTLSFIRYGIPNQSANLVDIVPVDGPGTIVRSAMAPYFSYTPAKGFTGQEYFRVTYCDPPTSDNCTRVLVAVDVNPAEAPGFPQEMRFVTQQGTPLPLDLPLGLRNNINLQRSIAEASSDRAELRWNSETLNEYLRYDPRPEFFGMDTVLIYPLVGNQPLRAIIEVQVKPGLVEEDPVEPENPVEPTDPIEPEPKDFLLYGKVSIAGEVEAPGDIEICLLEDGNRDLGPLPLAPDGSYQLRLPYGKSYLFRSESGFYYPYSESVVGNAPEVEKNIELQPIPMESGTVFTLRNVYFDLGKSTLRPESTAELKRLYQFLRENPQIEIRIEGHTDNQNTEAFNQKLSEDRVQSVINYLKYQGIMGQRLTGKGFGESKPVDTNETPEGRQNNRRVEVIVTKQ